MSRSTDYLRKPTDAWTSLKTQLEESTFYLVQRYGPTVFSIRSEEGNMFKVTIGDPNKCSCNSRPGEHCIHIVYCLLKVLRIPCENHMSWQTGYTDTEIDIVLAGNFRGRVVRPVMKRAKPEAEPTAIVNPGGSNVPRQPLEGDECYCPICQDLMNITQALSWCRKGCGNNVHAKCMKMYAQYKLESKADVACPLCREEWVSMAELNEDCRSAEVIRTRCAHVSCSACTIEIRGDFYRCIECSLTVIKMPEIITDGGKIVKTSIDFCKNCFDRIGRAHSSHHFINSDVNTTYQEFTWQSVINPRGVSSASNFPPELLQSLQGRELTAADYDLLLALDERKTRAPPLSAMLIESLPEMSNKFSAGMNVAPSRTQALVCLSCKLPSPPRTIVSVPCDPVSLAIANLNGVSCEATSYEQGSVFRILPCCQGLCHTACLENSIKLTMKKECVSLENEGDNNSLVDINVGSGCLLDRVICCNESCKKVIFGRLSRRKRKKASVMATSDTKEEVALAPNTGGATGFGFEVSGTAIFGQTSNGVSNPTTSSNEEIDRRIAVRPTAGRRSSNEDRSVTGQDLGNTSQLALNALHMSLAGQTSNLSSKQGGSSKLAKGLTRTAARRASAESDLVDALMRDISIRHMTEETDQTLPPSGRVVSRQVGGRAERPPRRSLNRYGPFRGNLRSTRGTSSFDNTEDSVLADDTALIVRSVSADTSSCIVNNYDMVPTDRTDNTFGNRNDINSQKYRRGPSSSTQYIAENSNIDDINLGDNIGGRIVGRRATKGALVKPGRMRPIAVKSEVSSVEHLPVREIDLFLNVNHYA